MSRLVLGIETSCDETGAAVLDEKGEILGESLHSQKHVHLRWVMELWRLDQGRFWLLNKWNEHSTISNFR